MEAEAFLDLLPCRFFSGVPDSLLSAFSAAVIRRYGEGSRHVIAANEGNAVGLAAGYYAATGEIPCVYLQNSGIGNIINPVTSLLSPDVYGIPCLFLVGWRGEPGVHDEPQHAFMGRASAALLEAAGIRTEILGKDDPEHAVREKLGRILPLLRNGESAALLVEKGALTGEKYRPAGSIRPLKRERAVEMVLDAAGDDPVFCTTGKASRELFELRERRGEGHERDFLTVGSMGHCSSIAAGYALQRPEETVWCVDGDGAALMHLGALAVIAKAGADNLIHVVIKNAAHESVGGQPTAADTADLVAIADGAGYRFSVSCETEQDVRRALARARAMPKPAFIEIFCAVGAREDLGRPSIGPKENLRAFMRKEQRDE